MSTTLVTPESPTTRKRRRKTRTKTTSHLPAIVASELPAAEIDLTPGREHLVCPTCERWTPLTGVLGTPKLVPHHIESARSSTEKPHRCSGSNRQVDINLDIEDWRTEWTAAAATAAARRATKVLRKPKSLPAPAVSQITPAPFGTAAALDAYRQHLQLCRKTTGDGRCEGKNRCADGRRLAAVYAQALRTQPLRDRERAQESRTKKRLASGRAAQRTAQWAAALPAVKDTDTLRADLPAGNAPTEARSVPLAPHDEKAFNRRQAELGRRYAARTAAA